MDAGTLHDAISEVCPVETTRVVDGNNRATWSFEPSVNATQVQIDAGNRVIATLPVDVEFVSRLEPNFDMGGDINDVIGR